MITTIERTRQFKKDIKREGKTYGVKNIEDMLAEFLNDLAGGKPIAPRYKDHLLTGNWAGCRDCHLKPDLLMIYGVVGEVMTLHRLGSHAELFG